MYMVVHEGRLTNQKYIIKYDVSSKKFFIENEHHEMMEVEESTLFHLVDDYFTHAF